MRFKIVLTVALACLALLTEVAAAGMLLPQSSQANSNANQAGQNQNDPAAQNSNGGGEGRRRRGSSAQNSNDREARRRQEEQQDEVANPSRDDQPGSNVPRPARTGGSRYRFEFGVLPRYVSNYFQTVDESFQTGSAVTPQKSVFITTLSGSFEYDLVRRDDSTLRAGVRLRRNIFGDLDEADSTDVDVHLEYDFSPNRLRFTYFGTPRRLISSAGGRNVFSRVNGFSIDYSRRLTRRWRARGAYEFGRDTFSAFQERNLSRHEVNGDVRYQVRPFFTPGIGFEYLRANAESVNFSYNRPALALLLSSRIRNAAYLSFRYRYSDRDYVTNDPTSSNFRREDRRHDVSLYGTAQLGRGFSLFGFIYHTDNNSTLVTRSYNSYETGLGLFYRFP